ncbi:MAG: glycosyltransferase [Vicinamibacteria bacterium]
MDATIVIPTFDRRPTVLRTLEALASGTDGVAAWEAIVVDDGSRDGTSQAVESWARARGLPVRCLVQRNAGPASARNHGAREAKGRVLAFLDDDIHVRPGFLARHLDVLGRHPGSWVVGRVVHPEALRATPFGRWRDDQWESFHRAHAGGLGETQGMTAAHLAVPREELLRLGGFDEAFPLASCEDAELALRARAHGVRILYDPENVALHDDWAVSLPRYCERQRTYSVADVLLWRKYGARSPRETLVLANGPALPGESLGARTRKAVKAALATAPGRVLLRAASRAAETVLPDSAVSRRLYGLAIGVAIFRGVREGFRRFPDGGGTAP